MSGSATRSEDRMLNPERHRVRTRNPVPAIHQDFGLHDGHEARLLRQRRKASQSVRVHPDAVLARNVSADPDDRAPLGEACSELAVLREAVA
jgi:hypothetical protein